MKCKALILLFIFLLNTFAGVSCALHMFHKDHDENGEDHEHHHHGSALRPDHQKNSGASAAYIDKDQPCCQKEVNIFVSLAKLVPPSVKVIVQSPVTYTYSYCQLSLKPLLNNKACSQISFDERQRPPTKNIRITIKSFQI